MGGVVGGPLGRMEIEMHWDGWWEQAGQMGGHAGPRRVQ